MQFTTLFAFASVVFGVANAWNPIGQPCDAQSSGVYDCAADEPSINNGNSFIYMCDGQKYQLSALCRGHDTCKTEPPKAAFCT
ncbi:hypothetical protein CYLTODRAFT_457500 [Cylindrobasidium torrendii FP15055 ss-10]|uniref:Carbohydrate-binding module family 19 domain-containing protein n=1 Tax=Cylindrobasidium torrendii FP15055 ss-10 TaxID=1314674 RepID=A0A0D7B1R7_9AGAR|nr:hypothetical protein CYLTODRAFT_457500 [Cylindrobasidium torrendii FP15055 ss-10]